MRRKNHSVAIGRFWLLLHVPLLVSYAIVGSNVLASTPAFRKYFIKTRSGPFWFNLGTALVSLTMSAGVIAPAIALGDALHGASVGYNEGMAIVRQANSTGDITQLLALQGVLGKLGEGSASLAQL